MISFFYGQACARSRGFVIIIIIAAAVLLALGEDVVLIMLISGLVMIDWCSSVFLGGRICSSFPNVDRVWVMTYAILSMTATIGAIGLSGWLAVRSLIGSLSKGTALSWTRCVLAFVLMSTIFIGSSIPPLLDNDMGSISSVHRIMYEAYQKNASQRQELIELLMCSRIPIFTKDGKVFMTREAADVLFNKYALSRQEYQKLATKKCPVGSEGQSYPLIPTGA